MIDYLEKLLSARTIQEIWSLHCNRMAAFGFDRLLYGFTRFRTSHGLGNLEDTLILSNHDHAYLEGFVGDGLYNHAPMVKWAAQNQGACSWSRVEAQVLSGQLTQTERRVLEFNLRFDVRAGYSISFPDVTVRAKGAIGLCAARGITQAEVDQIWDRHGREIMVLNNIAHLRICSMPYATARRALTPRQREVLEWVAEGKTTADIATIMGLTAATVEKHLRLAREALDVDTTAQAVLKASMQNQIFLSSNGTTLSLPQ